MNYVHICKNWNIIAVNENLSVYLSYEIFCAWQDYVNAMWLMLQQEKPEDYVISSGESHTVREFVERAFKLVGIDMLYVTLYSCLCSC